MRARISRPVGLLLLLAVATAGVASAQTAAPASSIEPAPAALAAPAAAAAMTAPPAQAAASGSARHRVLAVEPRRAGLGERIVVRTENLAGLLAAADGRCSNLVLFLDTVPVVGMEPLRCNLDDGSVAFQLELDETNAEDDAAWHSLLGSPSGLARSVHLSLGPSKDLSIDTDIYGEQAFQLVVLYEFYFYLWLGVTVLVIACAIWLGARSNLLRDPFAVVPEGAARPFSLSRFQAVFWFVLVLVSFFLIWSISGELGSITGSVLGLLGIGSGTALGAALIDSDKSGKAPATAAAAAAAPPTVTTTAAAVNEAPQPVKQGGSQGFLRDILSGEDGISFHRFQMFVWTIVLGLIFCSTVYDTLSMPQFDASLLALLGLSSATYLGFKIPEQHTG